MSGINKVIIVGRLGADPEISYAANGSAVAKLSVATSEKWKNKDGEYVEKTEWHRLVAFARTAEIIGDFLKKGSLAYFEGKNQTTKYQDKEGNDRYSHEVVVMQMQMLDSKASQEQQGQSGQLPEAKKEVFDDDIPF